MWLWQSMYKMNDVVMTQRFTFRLHYEQCRRLGWVYNFVDKDSDENAGCLYIRGGGDTSDDCPVPPTLIAPKCKRKRANTLVISESSVVFHHATNILNAAKTFFTSKDGKSNGVSYPDTLDELLNWGRDNVRPLRLQGFGTISIDDINSESMKLVLAGVIKPNDIIEKIQYTIPAEKVHLRKYRHKSYFRSDYYNTVHFNEFSINPVEPASIFREPERYPLYLTLKRLIPTGLANGVAACDRCSPPQQKRQKRCESINPTPPDNSGIICLLDSSDEEVEKCDLVSNVPLSHSQSSQNNSDENKDQSPVKLGPLIAPPDPPLLPFQDDEFILTPFGPGKILSWRVERHALGNIKSCNAHSDGTIYNPTLIYSIDLDYGICHIPASQVKSISGTHYTEHTLLTYQRVPITEFDLLRLRPLTYLNDSIVNFYLKYLKVKYDEKYEKKAKKENSNVKSEDNDRTAVPERPIAKNSRGWDDLDGDGVYIFPSFFYTRMVNIFYYSPSGNKNNKANRKKIWSSLKSWTKGVDIFKKKLLIFPINGSLHWTFVCVFHPGRLVRRYSAECKEESKRLLALAEKIASKKNGKNVRESQINRQLPPVKGGAKNKISNKKRYLKTNALDTATSSKVPSSSIISQRVKQSVSTKDQSVRNVKVDLKNATTEAVSTNNTAINVNETFDMETKESSQSNIQPCRHERKGTVDYLFQLEDEVAVEGRECHTAMKSQPMNSICSIEPMEQGVLHSKRKSEQKTSNRYDSTSFASGIQPQIHLQTDQETAQFINYSLLASDSASVKESKNNPVQYISTEVSANHACKLNHCRTDKRVKEVPVKSSTPETALPIGQVQKSTACDVVTEQDQTDFPSEARSKNISCSIEMERSGNNSMEKNLLSCASGFRAPEKESVDLLSLQLSTPEEKSDSNHSRTMDIVTSAGLISCSEGNNKVKMNIDEVAISQRNTTLSPSITSSLADRNDNRECGQNGATSVEIFEDSFNARVVEETVLTSPNDQFQDPPSGVYDRVAEFGRKENNKPSTKVCENNRSSSSSKNGMKPPLKSQLQDTKVTSSTKWKCDNCNEKVFATFDDAAAHEKICDKNIDWCMIHFDSGKHFKLHSATTIFKDIRKYLFAFYEGEYIETHPGMPSITHERMPGFSVPVPVQDNTKDCGLYMLHMIEKLLLDPPRVDGNFIRDKIVREHHFGMNMFGKDVIKRKRGDILQLVHKLRTSKLD